MLHVHSVETQQNNKLNYRSLLSKVILQLFLLTVRHIQR